MNIDEQQKQAYSGLESQAQKMIRLFNKKSLPIADGTCVKVPIPSIDRAKGEFKYIIGITMGKNDQDMYKVGTKSGILKDLFARNQIQPRKIQFFTLEDVK